MMIGNLILNMHEFALISFEESKVIDVPLENCKLTGGAYVTLQVKA
jgi:hypothetical protein